MKKIIILLLVVSCGNPKTEIVEKQKKLQSEIGRADAASFLFKHDALRFQMLKRRVLTDAQIDTIAKLSDSADYYTIKKAKLQGQYDSLEMELKKY